METQKNSDILEQLPVDKINPTPDELHIMDTLFKQHKTEVNVIFMELKDCLIIAILFILFSLSKYYKVPIGIYYKQVCKTFS